MTARYLPISAPDFFGVDRAVEISFGPDLRNVTPFADELARELAKAEAIRLDPFKHFGFRSVDAILRQAQRAFDRSTGRYLKAGCDPSATDYSYAHNRRMTAREVSRG